MYRFALDADRAASTRPQFALTLPGAGVDPVPNMPFFFIREISISLPLPASTRDLDSPAPFAMNSDSAVLLIDFTTVSGLESGNYTLLVPTSSLRAVMSTAHNSSHPNPSLDWGVWGNGALLLHTHELAPDGSWLYRVAHGRLYGSRMPVLVSAKGSDATAFGQILIIEMDPWASKYAHGMADAEDQEASTAAVAMLRGHVQRHLYGHPSRPTYTVYRGPVISRRQFVEPDGVVMDEHGVSILVIQTCTCSRETEANRGPFMYSSVMMVLLTSTMIGSADSRLGPLFDGTSIYTGHLYTTRFHHVLQGHHLRKDSRNSDPMHQ